MINSKYIKQWRIQCPWPSDDQVEQDLILCKAIIMIFNDEYLAQRLVMLGGTAIYKLIYMIAVRYSEDIDLALIRSMSKDEIFQIISKIKQILGPWLGKAIVRDGKRVTINFGFKSSSSIPVKLKLKLDIDTVETFSLMEYNVSQFDVQSEYFNGSAKVRTLQLEECIAKKMRALGEPSRIKGRDLFDIWYALKLGSMNVNDMLDCFFRYMEISGKNYSKEHYEKLLTIRLKNPFFRSDTARLMRGIPDWDIDKAGIEVKESIISKLPSRT